MTQTLLIGLGGTGSRIINHVASELGRRGSSINDGSIACAVLDTNKNDNDKIAGSGVGVPVIATSKDRKIKDYVKMYANKGVENWLPESPSFMQENIKDGASQMRSKSRLAFMDTVQDRTIHELEGIIDKLFENRDGNKIRVMIVSSLAGGTGSGMFIQVALWLRKYFEKRRCSITIRGIFILPDVFVNTLNDIQEDNTEIQSLYANAYGAVRELNAITKIKKDGYHSAYPIKIGDLFDSEKDCASGSPVFDYAFFVDNVSENGSVLSTMDEYEKSVARLVYMQLYAPMSSELYSEEDNLFKRFQKSKEPVFGSCGTAKAVYPTQDIIDYCALRSFKDSMSSGWRKIDDEIKAKQKKEDEKEKNGTILTHRLNPRVEYVKIFEQKSAKSGLEAGKDRLFINIANDTQNEERFSAADGSIQINYTDKINDFAEQIEEVFASTIDNKYGDNFKSIKLKDSWVSQSDCTKENLSADVENIKKKVKIFLEEVDNSIDEVAEEVVDLICPNDMGDINENNSKSVYGLLTKKNNNDEIYFIHPIVARYLLYRLYSRFEEIKGSTVLDQARSCAEKGYGNGKSKITFDNPKTRAIEDDAISYLNSKAFLQNEEKFIKTFLDLYSQHNKGQYELCRTYAILALKLKVSIGISKRLEVLINCVEDFFKNLDNVSTYLDDAIADNIRRNDHSAGKVIFVCGTEKEKNEIYKSLRVQTENSNATINANVVKALYGKFCAKDKEYSENNAEYVDRRVEDIFFRDSVAYFKRNIIEDNKEDIDLDIYSAVCKSADIEYENQGKKEESFTGLDVDSATGISKSANERYRRHYDAMAKLVDRLVEMGSPFLIADDEQPEDANEFGTDIDEEDIEYTNIKKRKRFWGFHPDVAEKFADLGKVLKINVKSQQSEKYLKNELDCYRAVYGIQAKYIYKFNEINNGDYFKCYNQIVREMVKGVDEGRPEELIHTPHIDKTWHLILPYITPEKQLEDDEKFYRRLWLSLAYGLVSLDNNGKYEIERTRTVATGQYKKKEPILFNGDQVGKVDISKLISALRVDGKFMIDSSYLELKFKEECEKLENYEGTEFLRGVTVKDIGKVDENGKVSKYTVGGLATKLDTNAVTVIVRYNNNPKHDDGVTVMLVQSLEKLCRDLVANKYSASETSKIEYKGYELCRRIYVASSLKDKDIEFIKHWKEFWTKDITEE